MRIDTMYTTFLCILALLVLGCGGKGGEATPAENLDWPATVAAARGQTVDFVRWAGDPLINDYLKGYVAPAVAERYGITLNLIPGQGSEVVQVLLKEIEAGRAASDVDLCWINGETFYQLRQLDALAGPWTESLPNARYIDFDNPFIGTDFQQPIDGYELPWGNVQMTLIYDSLKVPLPPRTRPQLLQFVKDNAGRFTFDVAFTGLTFLKALLIDIAGGKDALIGPFDEAKYAAASQELWAYLNELKPYLWRQGRTFPDHVAPMHQMFANGELWFTMSNNDAEVDNKIAEGVFPTSARAYVPDFGTIQNSHYLGIPRLAVDKAAARVVANFLVSPEAQLRKAEPATWGDGSVLSWDKLPDSLRLAFENLPGRVHAPDRAEISERALQELAPEYIIRLAEDFRRYVINE